MLIAASLLLAGSVATISWLVAPTKPRRAAPVAPGALVAPVAREADPDDAIGGDDPRFPLYMGASATALALGTAGRFVHPVFALLSVPPFLVALVPFVRRLVGGARDGSHRGVVLVEFASMAGTLALGQVLLAQICAAVVLASQWLLKQTEDRSRLRLFSVVDALPQTARVERDNLIAELPLDEVELGDVVHLKAGQLAPVDGVVISGWVQMDERTLTGESRPVERGEGEPVLASTLVVAGHARVRVERSGRDSVAAEVVSVLNRTADYRAEVRSRGQQIVEAGAPPTLALSALAWLALGPVAAVAVLFSAFGYNMRYAAPIAVLTYLERTSREGVLVKDGRALEQLAEVDLVVFDKTGTLTPDALTLDAIEALPGVDAERLLQAAAVCERHQRHPIARAILDAAEARGLAVPEPVDTRVAVGWGVQALVAGARVAVGGARMVEGLGLRLPERLAALQARVEARGGGVVFVVEEGALLGGIALSAGPRPEAARVIAALKERGVEVCILSGDRAAPTRHLARRLGIARAFAEVLPQDKARIVAGLQAGGRRVCFVGDGLNDLIALRQADVSISLAGASNIAADAAPIVLMSGDLTQLPEAFALAHGLRDTLRKNAVLSVAPGVLCVAGVFAGQVGLAGAVLVENAALTAAVGNSLRPLLASPSAPSPEPSPA